MFVFSDIGSNVTRQSNFVKFTMLWTYGYELWTHVCLWSYYVVVIHSWDSFIDVNCCFGYFLCWQTSIFPFNLFQYCLLYCMYVCIWFKVNRIKCVIYLNNTCIPRTVSSIYRVHIEQISNTYRVHIDQISNTYV